MANNKARMKKAFGDILGENMKQRTDSFTAEQPVSSLPESKKIKGLAPKVVVKTRKSNASHYHTK